MRGADGVRTGEGEAARRPGLQASASPDHGAGAGDEVEDARRQAGVDEALDQASAVSGVGEAGLKTTVLP